MTSTSRHQGPPATFAGPVALPEASYSYLERAARSLREAVSTTETGLRYAHAHVAALRATAALLAARTRPSRPGRRGRVQRNAWVLLAEVAPEFSEWATFFAAGAAKRAAAEAGARHAVTEREADDLVRDADRFLGLVERSLGVSRHAPCPEYLPGCLPAGDRPAGNLPTQAGGAAPRERRPGRVA